MLAFFKGLFLFSLSLFFFPSVLSSANWAKAVVSGDVKILSFILGILLFSQGRNFEKVFYQAGFF